MLCLCAPPPTHTHLEPHRYTQVLACGQAALVGHPAGYGQRAGQIAAFRRLACSSSSSSAFIGWALAQSSLAYPNVPTGRNRRGLSTNTKETTCNQATGPTSVTHTLLQSKSMTPNLPMSPVMSMYPV